MLGSKDEKATVLRADSTMVASGRGRNSLRLTSKAKYNHALVVIDLDHVPGNACGIWPAFWTTGPNWPNNGEIDIIEGVNMQSQNQMTLHTSDGCSLAGSSCLANKGCPAKGGAYGDGFNENNGGTYAMEWHSSGIYVWYFPRGHEPKDILGDSPDPKQWGNPTANFDGGSGCDIDSHFKDQNIVFDTTFCGDWAGQGWSSDPVCSSKAPTCQEYVQNNPKAFTEAYWEINALKVYTNSSNIASGPDPQQSNSSASSSSPGPVQQPSTTSGASMVTSFVDGGPVTIISGPAPLITEVVTGLPVTMTLAPGQAMPKEQFRQEAGSSWSESWSESWSSPGRRRRGRRQHLAEHFGRSRP